MTDNANHYTKTLAHTYLSQGYSEKALHVFRQLAEKSPEDAALQQTIADLENQRGDTQPSAGPVKRESLSSLFQTWVELAFHYRNVNTLKKLKK